MSERAVFDCMLYLQAAARPERNVECFELVRAQLVTLIISPPVIAEIEDVLSRPKLQRKFPALTPDAVRVFLDDVLKRAVLIDAVPHVFSLPRDPKDEKYLDLSIAASVAYLVTRDNDLLDLMDERTSGGDDLRARCAGLRILRPMEFIGLGWH